MNKLSALVSLVLLSCAIGCESETPPTDECTGEGADALKTCAKGSVIKGIDVSVYQGTVNWASVKTAGKKFAFIRVSDGNTTIDSKFAANWPAAHAAGVMRGAYLFFRASQDPVAQAKTMAAKINAAGGMKPGDLPPVLDLETADGEPSATVISRAKTWLTSIEKDLGIKPIVYTAEFMSGTIGSGFGGYTLWVANYGVTCPSMPSGWTDWHFWQDTDNGQVGGISGDVDTDQFNGTLVQLQAMTMKGPPVKATPGVKVDVTPGGSFPNDGSQGATLGSGNPAVSTAPAAATPPAPCGG